jgi:hypothetical protein
MFDLGKPLFTPPEAVLPGPPFGIEVLKGVFLLSFALSLIGLVPGLHSMRSKHFVLVVSHNRLAWLWSLGYAALFGVGFCGVHRRMRGAWNVGWFYLAFFYLETIVQAMTSTVKLPTPDRWIASSFVFVGFSAVAVYWGSWWNKQKRYFIRRP